MDRIIGAHLSTSGGYAKALEGIALREGNCLQIFSSSPRTWASASPSADSIMQFTKLKSTLRIDPVYFHANYLINLADPETTGEKSVLALIQELHLAHQMGVRGSIVHTGSFKNKNVTRSLKEHANYPILLGNIQKVLAQTPEDTFVILENAGTRKIGETIDQLGEIIHDIVNPRLKICLDTCHLHAAGYALTTQHEFDSFLANFDKLIGMDQLELIHMNDSRDSAGSLRDRHENIGQGFVNPHMFQFFLNEKRTRHVPIILETPGFDGNGPDKKNIDILKSFITE